MRRRMWSRAALLAAGLTIAFGAAGVSMEAYGRRPTDAAKAGWAGKHHDRDREGARGRKEGDHEGMRGKRRGNVHDALRRIVKESPALKAEIERFRQRRKELFKEVMQLRKKASMAIREGAEKGQRPTPEQVAQAMQKYQAEFEAIAAKLFENRVVHEQRKVEILKESKAKFVGLMTKHLMAPRQGKGMRGRRERPRGEGRRRGTPGEGGKKDDGGQAPVW